MSRARFAILLSLAACAQAHGEQKTNPHESANACLLCHSPTTKGVPPEEISWTGAGPDETCKTCHKEDPHQVGLKADRTQPQPVMTLYNGVLACFTCHDNPACDGRRLDEEDPYFFRGGPYDSQGELCARCHQVSGQERFNPHEAMAKGERGEVCEHCHLETPDPEAEAADLKITGPNICLGCHAESPHVGARLHLGPLDKAMARSASDAGLPLHDGRDVVCVTCHDPHPSSVKSRTRDRSRVTGLPAFPDSWREQVMNETFEERSEELGAQIKPVMTESDYLRLPLEGGQLCKSCHDSTEIEALRRSRR